MLYLLLPDMNQVKFNELYSYQDTFIWSWMQASECMLVISHLRSSYLFLSIWLWPQKCKRRLILEVYSIWLIVTDMIFHLIWNLSFPAKFCIYRCSQFFLNPQGVIASTSVPFYFFCILKAQFKAFTWRLPHATDSYQYQFQNTYWQIFWLHKRFTLIIRVLFCSLA